MGSSIMCRKKGAICTSSALVIERSITILSLAMSSDTNDPKVEFETRLREALSNPWAEGVDGRLMEAVSALGDTNRAPLVRRVADARQVRASLRDHIAVELLMRVELALREGDAEGERAKLLREIARVRHEHLVDNTGALEAYHEAQKLEQDIEVAGRIAHLQQMTDNWKELGARFARESKNAPIPSMAASLTLRAASLAWQYRSPRPANVAKLFDAAATADPANISIIEAYLHVLRTHEEWARFVEVAQNASQAVRTDAERTSLLLKAARASGYFAGNPGTAAELFESMLEEVPGQPDALGFLAKHYESEEKWDQLAEIYKRQLALPHELDEERRILSALGQLYWLQLGDNDAAREHFERLLNLDASANDALSFFEEQLSGSDPERLAKLYASAARSVDDTERRVSLLARAAEQYESAEDAEAAKQAWSRVLELDPQHQKALAAAGIPGEALEGWRGDAAQLDAAAALQTYAENLEEFEADDYAKARSLASQVFANEPTDEAAHEALMSIYEHGGRWKDVAEHLRARATAMADEKRSAETWSALGVVAEDKLDDSALAREAFEHALAADTENLVALARLDQLLQRTGDAEARATMLERRVGDSPVEEDAPFLRQLAVLCAEDLGDHARAMRAWKTLVTLDPTDAQARAELIKSAERAEDWSELVFGLSQVADNAEQAERAQAFSQIARVQRKRLGDAEAARLAWQKALEIDPGQEEARQGLLELVTHDLDWEALEVLRGTGDGQGRVAQVMERAAEAREETDAAIALATRAAEIYEAEQDAPGAERAWSVVLTKDPEHEGAKAAMEAADKAAQAEARAELEARLTELAEKTKKARGKNRIKLLQEQADIAEHQLRDDRRAFELLVEIWRKDADADAGLERLRNCARRLGDESRLVEIMLEAAADLGGRERSRLRLRAAEVLDVEGSQPEAAAKAYADVLEDNEAVAELRGEDVARAAQSLQRLARELNDSVLLRKALVAEASFGEDVEHRDALLREAAQLAVEDKDIDAALAITQQRVELQPDAIGPLRALAAQQEAAGRWEDLSGTLLQQAKAEQDPQTVRDLWLRRAKVFAEQLGDIGQAGATLEAYTQEHGPDTQILEQRLVFFRQAEDWEACIASLRALAEHASDATAKADYAVSAGSLLSEHLDRPGQAIEMYERALASIPEHQEAAAALVTLLSHESKEIKARAASVIQDTPSLRQDPAMYRRVLEVLAESGTGDEAIAALSEAARLAGLEGDDNAVFELRARLLRRLAGGPTDLADHLDDARKAAQRAGRTADYVTLLRDVSAEVVDGSLRQKLWWEIATLSRDELDDAETCRIHLEKLVESYPDDERALSTLRELLIEAEDWDGLAVLLERAVPLADDDNRRVALGEELAAVFEQHLERPADAIRVIEGLSDDGHFRGVCDSLARLYRNQGRWEQLSTVLDRQLEEGIGDPVELHYGLGMLAKDHLDEPARALRHFSDVVALKPDHEPTGQALRELLDVALVRADAAKLLDPFLVQSMDWQTLSEVLSIRINETVEATERADLLRRRAELLEQNLDEKDEALRVYADLLGQSPEDEMTLEALGRFANDERMAARVAAVVARVADESDAPDAVKAQLATVAAGIYERKLKEPAKAAELFEKAWQWQPDLGAQRENRERSLKASGSYEALADFYRELLGRDIGDEDREDILRNLAEVLSSEMGDVDGALDAWSEVVSLRPEDEAAFSAVESILREAKRHEALVEHLLSGASNTADEERAADLRYRAAKVLVDPIKNLARATEVLAELLAASPEHREAFGLVQKLAPNCEPAELLLLDLYRRDERWKEYVRLQSDRAERLEGDAKRQLLAEVARDAEEKLGDGKLAFGTWSKLLIDDPAYEQARAEARRLAEAQKGQLRYVKLLEQCSRKTDDAALSGSLLREAASIYDGALGDPRSAIKLLKKALDAAPGDMEVVEQLQGLYMMVGDWRGIVSVFAVRAENESDPDEKASLHYQRAQLLEEQLNDSRGALEGYWAAFEAAERADDDVLSALERLTEARRDFRRQRQVLDEQLSRAEDPERVASLALRLGDLAVGPLRSPDEAVGYYERAREIDPDGEAIDRLAKLYEQRKDWDAWMGLVEARVQNLGDDEAAALISKAAQTAQRRLNDSRRAMMLYIDLLRRSPGDTKALRALLDFCKDETLVEELAPILEPELERLERWNELVDVITRAAALKDEEAQNNALLRVATIHEHMRKDTGAAFEALSRNAESGNASPRVLSEFFRLAEQTKSYPRLCRALEKVIERTDDEAEKVALLHKLANVREHNMRRMQGAVDAYEEILKIRPDAEAMAALERIYAQTRKWKDLVPVYERQLESVESSEDRIELLHRLAEVQADKLNDGDAAAASYAKVLEIQVGEPRAIEALEKLLRTKAYDAAAEALASSYDAMGELEKAAALALTRATRERDEARAAELFVGAAQRLEKVGDSERALAAYMDAVERAPGDETHWDALERLCAGAEDARKLQAWSAKLLKKIGRSHPEAAYDALIRVAKWHFAIFGDMARGDALLVEALADKPKRPEAHLLRLERLRAADKHAEVVEALQEYAKANAQERENLLREAAELAKAHLGAEERIPVLTALHRTASDDIETMQALAKAYEEQGSSRQEMSMLDKIANTADGPAKTEATRRMAELYAGPLRQPKRAEPLLREILAKVPDDKQAVAALEGIYEGSKRWKELKSLLESQLPLQDSEDERIEIRIRLAGVSERGLRDPDGAITQLKEILSLRPGDEKAVEELGRVMSAHKRWDDLAWFLSDQAQGAIDAGNTQDAITYRLELARLRQNHGTRDEAIPAYQSVLELDPSHIEARYSMGQLYEEARRLGDAMETYEQILREQPGHIDAMRAFGRVAAELSEHKRLLATLSSMRESVQDPEARREVDKSLAHAAAATGDNARALELAQAVFQADETDTEALGLVCDLYVKTGRAEEAIPLLRKMVASFGARQRKEASHYNYLLGRALEAKGDTRAAIEKVEQAHKADLTSIMFLKELALMSLRHGDRARAQKSLRALLLQKLGPEDGITKADVYFHLADLHAKQREGTKAKAMVNRALSEDPEHAQAKQLQAQL